MTRIRPATQRRVPDLATAERIEAAWLADAVLLALVRIDRELDDGTRLSLTGADRVTPLNWTSWPSPGAGEQRELLMIVPGVSEAAWVGHQWAVTDAHGAIVVRLSSAAPPCDLRTLLRLRLAALPAAVRSEILRLVTDAAETLDENVSRHQRSVGLALMRSALRERLESSSFGSDQEHVVHADRLIRIDERSYLISGWLRSLDGPPARLTAVSPDGGTAELLPSAWTHPRPDLAGLFPGGLSSSPEAAGRGFVCRFDLGVPSFQVDGWLLEMKCADGQALEAEVPRVLTDRTSALGGVLEYLHYERPPAEELKALHLRPAIASMLAPVRRAATVEREAAYGRQPDSPAVSLVVPLYARIDLVEHQLAQLARDRALAEVELIYVLDSPELDIALEELAPHLQLLYGVSFRTVSLGHNGGFAHACNTGAEAAKGPLLLLLNSDVLPDSPGWLPKLAAFYRSVSGIGALGAKLLFEDDTLQHAGMFFARLPAGGVWENRHYFKGLDRELPQANIAREVPAVTAACMLTDADIYRELGGLSGDYVQGDYEDSDYCLRLARAGRSVWYLPEVELYHLEGQSYPSVTRARNLDYNRWLHTHLWDAEIEGVMARHAEPAGAGGAAEPRARAAATGRGADG